MIRSLIYERGESMEGPRPPKNEEFPEVLTFLNESLRNGMSWSISDEYPTTISEGNIQNLCIIREEQKIVSHALVKPVLVKTRRGIFKIGCIGSVVTDESYRNQGLSQTVLNQCLENLSRQGCELALLWTDLYEFYRKLGFELAGSEVSLIVGQAMPKQNPNLKIVQNNKVDPQALYRLYSQHSVGVIRTLEDFEKYLKIPNCRLYTAWNQSGGLEAYAVEGKGIDLQGYIHEWGGSINALVDLTSHIREQVKSSVTIITPSHAHGLIRKFEELGAHKVSGYLGMMKVLNPQSLFTKVVRNARQEWGIENFKIGQMGSKFVYSVGNHQFETEDEADMIRLLFGPKKPSELHDHGQEANAILDRFLPLEMWLWGWDSV